MKINKKLLGHAFESSILIVSSLVIYDILKIFYNILKIKLPKSTKYHKFIILIGNIISIFIIDVIIIIILDEYFNTNIV